MVGSLGRAANVSHGGRRRIRYKLRGHLRAHTSRKPLVQFPAMANLTLVLKQLEQERNRLTSQLESLNNALSALNGTGDKRTGRTISAAGRARVAAAQRAQDGRRSRDKGLFPSSLTRGR